MDKEAGRDRKVIPRWRAFNRTPSVQLESACGPPTDLSNHQVVQQKRLRFLYEVWRKNSSIENASELIDCAVFVQDPLLAVGAAQQVLDSDSTKPGLKELARLVVVGREAINVEETVEEFSKEEISSQARTVKQRLDNEPANGLLWLEKARLNTILGHYKKAEVEFARALACAPNNRFVLRAFARFAAHLGEPDHALRYLRASDALRDDPWIQAAEIATAGIAEVGPESVNSGRRVLQREHLHPVHTSELSAALGTLEATAGALKKAKRLFGNSLTNPTDNSLAQAVWAREEMKIGVPISSSLLTMQGAFEARTQAAMAKSQWQDAADNCSAWLNDESFSSKAAVTGSYIASSHLWDQELAIEFCRRGLVANPNDKTLINNIAVSLGRLDKLDAAREYIQRIQALTIGSDPDPTVMATMGLLEFRSGNTGGGRHWYSAASERAAALRDPDTRFRALVHWIYEEIRMGTIPSDMFSGIMDKVDDSAKQHSVSNTSRDCWEVMKARSERYRDMHTRQGADLVSGPQFPL